MPCKRPGSLARIYTVDYNAIWKTGFFVVGNFIEMHVFVKFVKHYLVVTLLGFLDLLWGGAGVHRWGPYQHAVCQDWSGK